MRQVGSGLGVWDGNAVKLGCDDHCTTINVIKFIELKSQAGSSRHGSAETNLTSIHEVQSVVSLSGLRIWHCHELCSRLQTHLRSCIAVAVV